MTLCDVCGTTSNEHVPTCTALFKRLKDERDHYKARAIVAESKVRDFVSLPAKAEARFTEIYTRAEWTFGANVSKSGHGSTLEYTTEYRAFLEEFLRAHDDVRSVVDIGCGDWAFSKEIDWKDKSYLGIDVVPAIVVTNKQTYGSLKTRFEIGNVIDETYDVPSAELYILKDVLQHLPSAVVSYVLARLLAGPKTKYVLVTNCFYQRESGQDTEIGGFRPLSPFMTPLSHYKPKLLKVFHTKAISLIEPGAIQ